MAFEISSVTNNYSTERAAVAATTKPAVSERQENTASTQNYSVKPVEIKRPEDIQSGNQESGGNGKEPTEKQVKSTIALANNELKHAKTGLDFKYHEATKRVSITVYDKDTKEVIREIPPEKSLDMLEKMWELAGMVVDDRR